MARNSLLSDLERASDLLSQADESRLDFAPDGNVSADIRELTGVTESPVDSHRANLRARIAAVVKAGDRLQEREPSEYVSRLIVACMRIGPPTDDRLLDKVL